MKVVNDYGDVPTWYWASTALRYRVYWPARDRVRLLAALPFALFSGR